MHNKTRMCIKKVNRVDSDFPIDSNKKMHIGFGAKNQQMARLSALQGTKCRVMPMRER